MMKNKYEIENTGESVPKISIIVPVYNVEQHLPQCLDSLLAQSYKDFELILVNDGSTDRSTKICDSYQEKDSRICVIHTKNRGPANARNTGIRLSKGEYILFCDSDDTVEDKWCEHFIEAARPEMDNCIFSGYKTMRDDKCRKVIGDHIPTEYQIDDVVALEAGKRIGFPWNICYYGEVLRKNKILYPTDVIVEDLPFVLCYLSHMKYMTYTGHVDYNYHMYEQETQSKKYYADGFTRWKEKYLATLQFIDSCVESSKRTACMKILADEYLYQFLHSLNHTFDKRNTWSLYQKIRHNKSIVQDECFRHCLLYADCSKENGLYINMLKKQMYLPIFILKTISKIKHKLKKTTI